MSFLQRNDNEIVTVIPMVILLLTKDGNTLYLHLQNMYMIHRHFTGHSTAYRLHLRHQRHRRRRRRHLLRLRLCYTQASCIRASSIIRRTTSSVEQGCPSCPHRYGRAHSGCGHTAAAAVRIAAGRARSKGAGHVPKLTVSVKEVVTYSQSHTKICFQVRRFLWKCEKCLKLWRIASLFYPP